MEFIVNSVHCFSGKFDPKFRRVPCEFVCVQALSNMTSLTLIWIAGAILVCAALSHATRRPYGACKCSVLMAFWHVIARVERSTKFECQ